MDRAGTAERSEVVPRRPEGWARHGAVSHVGPSRRSLGYAVDDPPWSWPRGAPGNAALAVVATRPTSSTPF